jgi:hypothetical protein
MLARILLYTALLALASVSVVRAEPVAPNRREPPDCDYGKFPLQRSVKLRGVVSFVRYGGGRSANAPKWTTAYVLMLLPTTCEFEMHAPKDIHLADYDGYVVAVRGTITQGGAAAFYTLTPRSIHRVKHYEG